MFVAVTSKTEFVGRAVIADTGTVLHRVLTQLTPRVTTTILRAHLVATKQRATVFKVSHPPYFADSTDKVPVDMEAGVGSYTVPTISPTARLAVYNSTTSSIKSKHQI